MPYLEVADTVMEIVLGVLIVLHTLFVALVISKAPMLIQRLHSDDQRCTGLSGFIFGHRFQAAYTRELTYPGGKVPVDEVERLAEHVMRTDRQYAQHQMLEQLKESREHYHGHVCVRCGKRVNDPRPLKG
jgi:hypothetical protein